MSEAKFTKGPWAVYKYTDGASVVGCDGNAHVDIESLAIRPNWMNEGYSHWDESDDNYREIGIDEQMANAHLIAAAPEMYEMLQEMIDQYDYEGCTEYEYRLINSARELLAKARGEKETNK